MTKQTGESNRWKGFVLGLAGAGVGLGAMSAYWQVATQVTGADPRQAKNPGGPHALDDISLIGTQHEPDESSTAAIGRILYTAAGGKAPDKETTALLSNLVHYGYGLLLGGLYGAWHGGAGGGDVLGGLGYGTAVWLAGSEMAVPLLGLAAGPTTQPPASHAHALGAHWAFGLATAVVTQVLYRLL